MRIGVLALQGDFREHAAMLRSIGVDTVRSACPPTCGARDGLILPGGESTTIGKLAREYGLIEPVRALARAGKPVWGTCAGLILLARDIGARAAARGDPGRDGPAQRLRPPGGQLRGRPGCPGPRRRRRPARARPPVPCRLHPRPAHRSRRGGRRGPGTAARRRHRRRPPGQPAGDQLPPRADRRPPFSPLFPRPFAARPEVSSAVRSSPSLRAPFHSPP